MRRGTRAPRSGRASTSARVLDCAKQPVSNSQMSIPRRQAASLLNGYVFHGVSDVGRTRGRQDDAGAGALSRPSPGHLQLRPVLALRTAQFLQKVDYSPTCVFWIEP